MYQVWGLKMISSDTLASGSFDRTVKLWNTTSGTLIKTLANHTDIIYYSVDVLISNQILVSGSYDETIKTWNISTGQVLKTIKITNKNTLLIKDTVKNIEYSKVLKKLAFALENI